MKKEFDWRKKRWKSIMNVWTDQPNCRNMTRESNLNSGKILISVCLSSRNWSGNIWITSSIPCSAAICPRRSWSNFAGWSAVCSFPESVSRKSRRQIVKISMCFISWSTRATRERQSVWGTIRTARTSKFCDPDFDPGWSTEARGSKFRNKAWHRFFLVL